QGLHEPDYGGAHRVREEEIFNRLFYADGRDRHDGPASAGFHGGETGPYEANATLQGEIVGSRPLLLGQRLEATGGRPSRVRDEQVDAAKTLDGPVDERRHVLGPSDVGRDSEDLGPGFLVDRLDGRLERPLVARADYDLATFAGQGERRCAAHP